MNRSKDELKMFAEMTMKQVIEVDKKLISDEIEKIQSQYHIDHVWILKNSIIYGVVKIVRGSFYSLGLPTNVSNVEINQILILLEDDIKSYHSYTVEATIHEKILKTALERNYQNQFSRKKMELVLNEAMNLVEYSDIPIKPFYNKDLDEAIDLYIDAYKESIDEKVGMFGDNIAHSAIRSILRGNFGIFRPDLSGLIHDNKDGLLAAVLISISEDSPFIVIIGVRRANQNSGYGKKLLSWTIDTLINQQFDKLRLWVTIENTVALKLYENMGFKEVYKIHTVSKQLS